MRPPGPLEIGLILLIILIVFGVGKLPQVGAALGKGINAFRRGAKGEDEEETTEKTTKRKTRKKSKKTAKKAPAGESKAESAPEAAATESKPAEPSAEA
jgi:sec-independent protein translocase protein TatA